MRSPSQSTLRSPAAVAGIAVAILLLLGLGVLALRGGGEGDAWVRHPARDGSGSPTPDAAGSASPQGAAAGTSPTPPDVAASATDPASAADHALPAGTCIVDDGRAADVGAVQDVDCATEHTGEVYAATVVAQPADAPYPDADALTAELRSLCEGPAFADYVGTSYEDSSLFSYALMPTAETWAAGDRDVACILYDVTEPLTGSVRGSAR